MILTNLKARLLGLVRRGPRTVLWTPEIPMGIGNFFYFFLSAQKNLSQDQPVFVLYRPTMDFWLDRMPELRSYLVTKPKFTDRRSLHLPLGFGTDFSAEELERFCTEHVLRFDAIRPHLERKSNPTAVVINVRRGDYYSNPVHRANYAFNIDEYLRIALDGSAQQAPIESLHIVSDDTAWCKQNLEWMRDYAQTISYGASGDPMGNLIDLITADRLILANSTFSYWGGFLSNARHGSNHEHVWAPWFHARHIAGGRSYLLDPRWSLVKELPSGW